MIFHILREILKKQVDDVANLANNFTIFLEAILNAFGSFFFLKHVKHYYKPNSCFSFWINPAGNLWVPAKF